MLSQLLSCKTSYLCKLEGCIWTLLAKLAKFGSNWFLFCGLVLGLFFGEVFVVVVCFPFTSLDENFCECMAGIQFLVFDISALFFSALLTIITLFRFFCYLGQLRFSVALDNGKFAIYCTYRVLACVCVAV